VIDADSCYRALVTRDARFDGRFFTCVRTTGVYCRPICPARTPRRENVTFVPHAAAAEAAGFRPCRRCRPDAAPSTPAWAGTGATVSRGLRLIDDGAMEDAGVEGLASRLGVGGRHLSRLFVEHVGATPARIERTRRVHFARELVERTSMPITRVAFEAGFASVRQFNEAFRATFRCAPSAMRRGRAATSTSSLTLRLPYRPPYDWTSLARFLAARAIPGVESVDDDAYVRAYDVDGSPGAVRVAPIRGDDAVEATFFGARPRRLVDVVRRVRRMFDLGGDPSAVAERLRESATLRPFVDARAGLRIPGTWDAYEAAVRAILGQQIPFAAGVRLTGRVAETFGAAIDAPAPTLVRLFPEPTRLADADVARLGVPRARATAVRAVAAAFADGTLPRDGAVDVDACVARLVEIHGVGPWTAQYVALRGWGAPDAFMAGDLVLRAMAGDGAPLTERALAELADAWRPWRGYAVVHLWMEAAARKEATCVST
jgi:AraC family transcriptional regulator of adaptative response / DNA-3-methyladenine glycosylase II